MLTMNTPAFFCFFFSVVQTVRSFSIRMLEKGSSLTVSSRRIENVWVLPMNNRKVFFVFLFFKKFSKQNTGFY